MMRSPSNAARPQQQSERGWGWKQWGSAFTFSRVPSSFSLASEAAACATAAAEAAASATAVALKDKARQYKSDGAGRRSAGRVSESKRCCSWIKAQRMAQDLQRQLRLDESDRRWIIQTRPHSASDSAAEEGEEGGSVVACRRPDSISSCNVLVSTGTVLITRVRAIGADAADHALEAVRRRGGAADSEESATGALSPESVLAARKGDPHDVALLFQALAIRAHGTRRYESRHRLRTAAAVSSGWHLVSLAHFFPSLTGLPLLSPRAGSCFASTDLGLSLPLFTTAPAFNHTGNIQLQRETGSAREASAGPEAAEEEVEETAGPVKGRKLASDTSAVAAVDALPLAFD